MSGPGARWSDERVERMIGTLLRWGVIASATVVVLGGFRYLLEFGLARPQYRVFRGQPSELRNVPEIFTEMLHGDSQALLQFGILLLIATPVARVAFSVAAFAMERDRLYVVLTLVVLAVLTYSLTAAH